jgi:YHS domain-containing protein
MHLSTFQSDDSIGDSKHPEPAADAEHERLGDDDNEGAIDPVCGMTVDPATAREKGLHREHQGTDYYFCGKGCYLEFGDDPERFLDPSYIPSM